MAPQKPLTWLTTVLAVCLYPTGTAAAMCQADLDRQTLARKGVIQAADYKECRPVLIITHGDKPKPESFDPLVDQLKQDFNVFFFVYQPEMIRPRFDSTLRPLLNEFVSGLKTVEEASNQFDDAVRELLAQAKKQSVTVVGYSMGGLVTTDAMTSDRAGINTLARAGPQAIEINLVLVAVPRQGIGGVHVPVIGRVGAEITAAFADLGSTYYEPMSDRDYPFMRGRIGSNVRMCQVITQEEEFPDYVITEEGQEAADPASAVPEGNVHRHKAGHVGILTDPENAAWLARIVKDKAGLLRTRWVSMLDGLGAGGSFQYVSAPDLSVSFAQDLTTTVVNGQVGPTQTTTRDPASLNESFVNDWDLKTIAVDATAGVASWRDGTLRVAAEGSIGRVDTSLVVQRAPESAEPGSSATTFATDGWMWRAGVRGRWTPAPTAASGVFAEAAYRYERIGDLEVRRDPPLTAPGAVVTETDELRFRAHVIDVTAGYRTGRVTIAGGLRQALRRPELTGAATADFTATAGFPATQALVFVNRFSERATEVVGRAAIGLGGSPVSLLVDASRSGGWTSLMVGAIVRAGR